MPRSNRRPSRQQLANKLTDAQVVDALVIYRRELRQMLKDGIWKGDPDTAHPIAELTRLLYHPDGDHIFKLMVLKEITPYTTAPQSAQLKLNELGQRDFNITIVVPGWAASKVDEIVTVESKATSPTRALEDKRED